MYHNVTHQKKSFRHFPHIIGSTENSPTNCLCLLGEWPECGEGWPPPGGQHDSTGWQQLNGQSCHGCPEP